MTGADRRGRRASWIAAIFFVVFCGIAFWQLAPWFSRERYIRLREHVMRRNRFAIEDVISRAKPVDACGVLLVSIDGIGEADWRNAEVMPTLDSLRAVGREVYIDGGGTAPGGALESVVAPIARAAREHGLASAAIVGCMTTNIPASWKSQFDRVHNDLPTITSYLREGEATWVSLAGVRELASHSGEPFVLWLRYTELSPPHLRHGRLRIEDPRTSELAAIDRYLGQLLAFVRAVGCADRMEILVAASEANATGHVRGISVHTAMPDTVAAEDLPAHLLGEPD